MPVTFGKTIVRCRDVCTVEEALPLLEFLRTGRNVRVDLAGCTYLHTALVQVLLAVRPRITGRPADPALARWLMPLLTESAVHAV